MAHGRIDWLKPVNGALRALLVLVSRLIDRLESIDKVGIIGKALLWPMVELVDWIVRGNPIKV